MPCVRSEFEVASLNFPGQHHKWRLSEFLQKGRERSRDTLLDDLAFGLRFLVVTARARLVSHFFSLLQSTRSFMEGVLKLLGKIPTSLPSILLSVQNVLKERTETSFECIGMSKNTVKHRIV